MTGAIRRQVRPHALAWMCGSDVPNRIMAKIRALAMILSSCCFLLAGMAVG